MKLSTVNELLRAKLSTSYDFPKNEVLSSYVYEALIYVATKCEPAILTRQVFINDDDLDHADGEVFRYIRNNACLIIPDIPNFNNKDEHLMIDEALVFAVINYTCFLVSKDEAIYKKLCDEIIADYVAHDGMAYESSRINLR